MLITMCKTVRTRCLLLLFFITPLGQHKLISYTVDDKNNNVRRLCGWLGMIAYHAVVAEFYSAAWNASAASQTSHEKAVCSSVSPSVKRVDCVDCNKTEERSVQIFISFVRSFILVFWEESLVGGDAFCLKFWVKLTPVGRNRRFSVDIRW